MSFLDYKSGEKPFVPMVITVNSVAALSALRSVAKIAYETSDHKGAAEACAGELVSAIDSHAEENDIDLEYGV